LLLTIAGRGDRSYPGAVSLSRRRHRPLDRGRLRSGRPVHLQHHAPDYAREQFSSWSAIEARPTTTIAVPNVPYYIDKLRERLPRARVTLVDDLGAAFAQPDPAVDAIALPAERGSAWTLLYPQFTVVVPEPGVVKVPLAYAIARHDDAFASFVNTWIDLKRKDGTIERLYNYWVLGREAAPRQPRWSIIHDVLHWVH